MNDRLSPQIIAAHDIRAGSSTIAPSIEWLVNDQLRLTAGFNVKVGEGAQKFDDCRTCNPWAPFTEAYPGQPAGETAGLGGYEPLGRFRAGPIGMAQEEDEFQLTVRYSF